MDKKFIIGIIIFIVLIVGSAIIFAGNSSSKAVVEKTLGAKIQIDHSSKSLGDIIYDKGIVAHSFPLKNIGTKNLEVANLSTSCMCTKVYIKTSSEKSDEFGMKGMSSPSDWKGIIKPGESAEIVAEFDPQYHGPQGVGPISRSVSMETNDPDHPYVEFSFEGDVIK
ncbi:MAG TPA: DUF1573 domain-containing protein [Patescibacteria group bacterium]|nr:DUF1573 domain-containing protein [Patescibacteria group bacterium]